MSMHAVLYKVYQQQVESQGEQFDSTEVMNEYNLREFYRKQVELGYIHPDNLKDKEITVLDNPQEIDIDAILELLSDNDQWDNKHNYYVEQICIRLGDEDLYD